MCFIARYVKPVQPARYIASMVVEKFSAMIHVAFIKETIANWEFKKNLYKLGNGTYACSFS